MTGEDDEGSSFWEWFTDQRFSLADFTAFVLVLGAIGLITSIIDIILNAVIG
jgi:hypothetical protein